MRYVFLFAACLAACLVNAQTDYAARRVQYQQAFLSNPRAPLTVADTALLDFYPPQPQWAVVAKIVRTPDSPAFGLPTYSGQERPYRQYGVLYFEIAGKPYRLCVYQNLKLVQDPAHQDHLFLPFKDHTNGETTYGGGRYLDLHSADIQADDTLLLDFNLCYNPWCAFSDGYNCPIPPPVNELELAVEAGEKVFRGAHKHK
jgi:uncharacterized protein (DUF1684 family)